MELTLEAVALFALKLVYETDGGSPVLRDDLVMDGYEQGSVWVTGTAAGFGCDSTQDRGMRGAGAGGIGRRPHGAGAELRRLATDVQNVHQLDALPTPLTTLKDYLKDIL